MKAFFEEYGFVALAAIVVIILIVMASPIGTTILNSLTTFVSNFATNVSTWATEMLPPASV